MKDSRKKLDEIFKTSRNRKIIDQDVINDMDKYKNLSVEYARLELIIKDYKVFN